MTDRPRPPIPYDFLPQVPSSRCRATTSPTARRCPDAHVAAEGNTSPHLRWSGFPAETKGFAVTCFDPDAPDRERVVALAGLEPPGHGHRAAARRRLIRRIAPGRRGAVPQRRRRRRATAAPHRRLVTRRTATSSWCTRSTPTTSVRTRRRRRAQVGFNLTFHTLARGLIIPTYADR